MPIVLGVSPWTRPEDLFEIKKGRRPEPEESPAMKRGKVLEAVAAELYQERTGRKLWRSNQTIRHRNYDWMLAHLDRRIVGEGKGVGALEIKCPGLRTFAKCRREGLPYYYLVQLQHQMDVAGYDWGAFAVFNAELWEMIYFDVPRDQELIDLIHEKGAEFWNLVQTEEFYPADWSGPLADAKPVEIPDAKQKVITIESAEWAAAIERLRDAKEILTEAQALEKEAQAEIMKMMEASGAAAAEGAGARIYWIPQAGRKTFDVKAFAKAHPEINLAPFYKNGSETRPFRPYFLKGEARYAE
jgi:putative phage-type endonuclease